MKVSFYNLGCKVNFAELSQIEQQFRGRGYEIVQFGEKSDIVLINTCTVTNNADADSRKVIRKARRENPDAFIGVLGCYVQVDPGAVKEIDGVDAIFGTKEKFNILDKIDKFEHLQETRDFVTDTKELQFDAANSVNSLDHSRVFMKIQDGCDYKCTYCIIPKARGGGRSMPFTEIRTKLDEFQSRGFREVILSGINLGEYKAPTGENFTDVIRMIAEMEPNLRFRISSIEPNLLNDEIIDIVASSEAFCNHFHVPLQSGSPEILRKMRRRYNRGLYRERIMKVYETIPNCGIGIDVISGFPGETDEHFAETYEFLNSLPATYFHAFSYSERKGTIAAGLEQVDPTVRKERTKILRDLSEKKQKAFYKSQEGSTHRVVPEKFFAKHGMWNGFTDNYVKVRFPGEKNADPDVVRVKLNEFKGKYVSADVLNVPVIQ